MIRSGNGIRTAFKMILVCLVLVYMADAGTACCFDQIELGRKTNDMESFMFDWCDMITGTVPYRGAYVACAENGSGYLKFDQKETADGTKKYCYLSEIAYMDDSFPITMDVDFKIGTSFEECKQGMDNDGFVLSEETLIWADFDDVAPDYEEHFYNETRYKPKQYTQGDVYEKHLTYIENNDEMIEITEYYAFEEGHLDMIMIRIRI